MPQPNINQVHIDAPLTMISVAYMQAEANFIASKVFPIVPVDKKSDLYYKYTKEDWFRDEAKVRAPGTESAGSGYNVGTDNYNCDVFAFHKDVDDQTRDNADNPLNPDRDATAFVTGRMLLRQEKQWVSDNFTTGKWATDVAGVAAAPAGGQFIQWSDYTSSDPITDIEAGKRQILSVTGYLPNTMTISYDVFVKLKNHPDLIERVKYTTGIAGQVATLQILAQLFGLDKIHVAMAIENTAAEGAAGAYAFTHGKHALLNYVAPTPGLQTPSAGYTFMWKGVSGNLGTNVAVSRFRMQQLKSDRIEAEMAFDNKIVAADMGYFFQNAVA